EKTLKEAGVAADGAGLLAYLRAQTPTDAERAKLAATVRLLGHRSFTVRQKAQRTLTAAGRPALVYLKAALHDRDPAIARRAAWAVAAIERVPFASVMTAVAGRLAARRPPRTVEALLAYLPSVTEDTVEEAILQALLAVGVDEGKLHAALKAALTDREPSRRAAAAFVYG